VDNLDQKVVSVVDGFETVSGAVYDGINADDYNSPPTLEGDSTAEVNSLVVKVVLMMGAATCFGAIVDVAGLCPLRQGRPRWWVLCMLVASYSLLIPGLVGVVFSFDIVVSILGKRIDVQPERDTAKSCTESVMGLIELLQKTGSPLGAFVVFLYACVVPAAKLLLLLVAETLRFSESPALVRLARRCVRVVRAISKWASPDMFAYVLMNHLVRVLNSPPTILADSRLMSGFSCFAVFCTCSTVSSLGIQPPVPDDGKEARCPETRRKPLLTCCVGKSNIAPVAVSLTVIFLLLLWRGLIEPCMSLYIDQQQLYEPNGSLPYKAKPVVDSLQIAELLSSDVSVWNCISKLVSDLGGGEANTAFGLILLSVFVVGLTVLDMLALVLAAIRLRVLSKDSGAAGVRWPCQPQEAQECPFLSAAAVFNKVSMLDVQIMGIWVMTVCLSMYSQYGILVSMERGVVLLLAAEVVHAFTHWTVAGAVKYHLLANYNAACLMDPQQYLGSRHPQRASAEDFEADSSFQAGCCGRRASPSSFACGG
jgi:uncharacterized paraquat-inducible protein A